MEDALDVEQLLAAYYRMCAAAGVEPLPLDEAREQAKGIKRALIPAFAVSFRVH